MVAETTRVANRIHKTLEDANIKLGAVASDILGKSGRAMLRAILSGERNPRKLADLAKGALRRRIPELTKALQGHWTEHHTFMIRSLLNQVQYLEGEIEAFSEKDRHLYTPFFDGGADGAAGRDSGCEPSDG